MTGERCRRERGVRRRRRGCGSVLSSSAPRSERQRHETDRRNDATDGSSLPVLTATLVFDPVESVTEVDVTPRGRTRTRRDVRFDLDHYTQ